MGPTRRSKAPAARRKLTDAFLRSLKPTNKTLIVWDDLFTGLGIQITPNGVKSWKITYYHAGKLRWYTIGRYPTIGLAFAREECQRVRQAAALGEDPQAEKAAARRNPNPNHGETLAAVAEKYVERYAKRNNKSWAQADNLMRRYVLPTLGERQIADLRRKDILGIFDQLTNEANTPKTANQMVAAISAVLGWAVQQEIVPANVAHGIERNKSEGDERFLTDGELVLVWPLLSQPLRFMLLTASRPGEVCAMRWQDVDLKACVWTQPGAPADGWPGTKNAKTHDVPLSPQAIAILDGLDPQATGPVFPNRLGGAIKIPVTISLWKKLGIPRFRPHHLRATAASGMDALGISEEHIGRVLNHSKGGVTASYIRHDKLAQKRRALDAWGSHLMEVVERRTPESAVVDIRSGKAESA